MQIFHLENLFDVDPRVLRDLIQMTAYTSAAVKNHGVIFAYLFSRTFKFSAMVVEYTSFPIQLLCSAKLPCSRFHGFEHTTAASNLQPSPSSPRY